MGVFRILCRRNDAKPRWRRWLAVGTLVGIAMIAGVVGICFFGHWSGQIRLDTGDLRYCVYGIPITYDPMPEPERSELLAVAAKSSALKPKWVTCVVYPLPSSNNTDAMCREFYFRACAFYNFDPHLMQLLVEAIAAYVDQTQAEEGLPKGEYLCSAFVSDVNGNGNARLLPGWQQDQEVQFELGQLGYTLPAGPSH
jgi:hypothetical protein